MALEPQPDFSDSEKEKLIEYNFSEELVEILKKQLEEIRDPDFYIKEKDIFIADNKGNVNFGQSFLYEHVDLFRSNGVGFDNFLVCGAVYWDRGVIMFGSASVEHECIEQGLDYKIEEKEKTNFTKQLNKKIGTDLRVFKL